METGELPKQNLIERIRAVHPNTMKIIVISTIVFVLIAVNVFVVWYGKTRKEAGSDLPLSPGLSTGGGNYNLGNTSGDREAEIVLMTFFDNVKRKDVRQALSYVSVDTQVKMFEPIVNDGLRLGDTLTFNVLDTKFSSLGNYAFITVEVTKDNLKEYHKYTLVKKDGVWKIMLDEKIN